jgi:hypothetical protein
MKRTFFTLIAGLLPTPVLAQEATGAGVKTVNLTLASVNQPLYLAWYWIIYLTLAAVSIFLIGVLVATVRGKS